MASVWAPEIPHCFGGFVFFSKIKLGHKTHSQREKNDFFRKGVIKNLWLTKYVFKLRELKKSRV